MTFNGAIMQLVEMRENSMMPVAFKPYFDKVIETLSEVEPAPQWIPNTPENVPKDPFRKQIQLANGWIITGWFDGEDWYSVPGYDEPLKFEDVVAWCELPEPYNPESEE